MSAKKHVPPDFSLYTISGPPLTVDTECISKETQLRRTSLSDALGPQAVLRILTAVANFRKSVSNLKTRIPSSSAVASAEEWEMAAKCIQETWRIEELIDQIKAILDGETPASVSDLWKLQATLEEMRPFQIVDEATPKFRKAQRQLANPDAESDSDSELNEAEERDVDLIFRRPSLRRHALKVVGGVMNSLRMALEREIMGRRILDGAEIALRVRRLGRQQRGRLGMRQSVREQCLSPTITLHSADTDMFLDKTIQTDDGGRPASVHFRLVSEEAEDSRAEFRVLPIIATKFRVPGSVKQTLVDWVTGELQQLQSVKSQQSYRADLSSQSLMGSVSESDETDEGHVAGGGQSNASIPQDAETERQVVWAYRKETTDPKALSHEEIDCLVNGLEEALLTLTKLPAILPSVWERSVSRS